ncbi:MAG TPA: plastocyanin/azurin family copper-binding protein [Thermoleophilaceae bacterium]|nr:plastocyanin/azurin family copper-binding protein [Thermoleophilaceae bacterium]
MRLSLLVLISVCLLLASGCGDDSNDDSGGGSSGGGGTAYGGKKDSGGASASKQLKLTADPGGALKFDKTTLESKPGKVTVVLDNPSSVPHAIEVEGEGLEEEGKTVGKGGVSKVTVDLKAGEYEYYCPVGNHQAAGMEGTLTVG